MTAIRTLIVIFILVGTYILISVSTTNLILHRHSNGSLLKVNQKVIGSKLIGQNFNSPYYFMGRPSFNNYKGDQSGCTNIPYFSKELKEELVKILSANSYSNPDINLITESASGLDPHITEAGALAQINRISQIRGISKEKLKELIDKKAKKRILGIAGEKIINVLELNIELDKVYAR